MIEGFSTFIVAVVDDDLPILESIESLLESAGYTVRLFASAAAFLESGCLEKIDCLISDIGLPGMSGLELLRVARAARPDLPGILITGDSELLNPPQAASLHHHGIFQKPFDCEQLLAAIAGALQDARRDE